jgi:hypothetical protein
MSFVHTVSPKIYEKPQKRTDTYVSICIKLKIRNNPL